MQLKWRIVKDNLSHSQTRVMKVPGGMLFSYTDPGPTEEASPAVALAFVPCTPVEAKEWGF